MRSLLMLKVLHCVHVALSALISFYNTMRIAPMENTMIAAGPDPVLEKAWILTLSASSPNLSRLTSAYSCCLSSTRAPP